MIKGEKIRRRRWRRSRKILTGTYIILTTLTLPKSFSVHDSTSFRMCGASRDSVRRAVITSDSGSLCWLTGLAIFTPLWSEFPWQKSKRMTCTLSQYKMKDLPETVRAVSPFYPSNNVFRSCEIKMAERCIRQNEIETESPLDLDLATFSFTVQMEFRAYATILKSRSRDLKNNLSSYLYLISRFSDRF